LEAKRLLAVRARELDEKAAAFDQTISDRLATERANLSKEIEAQLRSGLSTEIADLKRQADERSERLAQAQAWERLSPILIAVIRAAERQSMGSKNGHMRMYGQPNPGK
jgi:hypothetical protein